MEINVFCFVSEWAQKNLKASFYVNSKMLFCIPDRDGVWFYYLSYIMWLPRSINTLVLWTNINPWQHLLYVLCKALFQSDCVKLTYLKTLWLNKSSLLRLNTLFKDTVRGWKYCERTFALDSFRKMKISLLHILYSYTALGRWYLNDF